MIFDFWRPPKNAFTAAGRRFHVICPHSKCATSASNRGPSGLTFPHLTFGEGPI